MSSMPAKGKHHHMSHHHSSHHSHQQGQSHHQQSPLQQQHLVNANHSVSGTSQSYNTVGATRAYVSHAGSEFHVPGQSYGGQPGTQVGGGGGGIGVPGGRGAALSGIPQIGQSTPGIQTGGPGSGQQQSPQPPTPGVQQQPPQGSAQTATPPAHAPSQQEMSKQSHLQAQTPSLQQSFVPNQPRPMAQAFYPMGQRPTPPRNLHRGNQGGTSHVVTIPNVATSTGQPPTMYQPNIAVPGTPTMYVSGQVSNLQQAPVYPMNNHMQPLFAYPSPQRHPPHQSPQFFPGYPPHTMLTPNVYNSYATGHQQWNCYQTHTPPNSSINLTRTSTNSVSGGGQSVGGPLVGAQGTTGVPQGTLQQQQPPPQAIPPMAMALSQSNYPGHSRAAQTPVDTYQKVSRRTYAIMDIVNPHTGENVAGEIYRNAATSEEPKIRDAPQMQDSAIAVDFASRVAKAASENGDNAPSTCAPDHILPSSLSPNSNKESINIQSDNAPETPVQSNVPQSSTVDGQLTAQETYQVESQPVVVKEWPHNDPKPWTVFHDDDPPPAVTNADNIRPSQSSLISPAAKTDTDAQSSTSSIATGIIPTPSENRVLEPVRESLSSSNFTSSSPPRRKSHHQQQNAAQVVIAVQILTNSVATTTPVFPSVTSEGLKEQEKKLGERTTSSRGTTLSSISHHTEQQQHMQKNGEFGGDKGDEIKVEQKSPEGKGTQKRKNNSKPKGRDLNRKGAEKEGTDMDAFAIPHTVKPENKTLQDFHEAQPERKNSNTDAETEILMKDKGTPEIKPDAEPDLAIPIKESSGLQQSEKNTQDHKETSEELTSTIEDSNKSSIILDKCPNDVVDHSVVADVTHIEAIIAHMNEENTKVSGLACIPSEVMTVPVIDKQIEQGNSDPLEVSKASPPLKYQYEDDQWSPKNIGGKKRYGRDLLMKLQEDPQSRVRPTNLLDLEVVLKDSTRQPTRNPVGVSAYKSNRAHEAFVPGFAKSSFSAKLPPPPNKKSYQGKKSLKPNVIHLSLSLREDVQLRETENAWKPTRLKSEMLPDEEAKSEALYKKVRSVLNKLTPQKFTTLVNQVRSLEIDTQERLQGVIDLVFEKAVDEPSFSVAYALMCKELSGMKVSKGEKRVDETAKNVDSYVDFRKLILSRCQMEFEKNTVEESARAAKVQEIENTPDPAKKKELQLNLAEEDRRIRLKSVGNIRFIGELYKQDMLVARIMHTCVAHLLATPDEENLECLCKLLTTIGKTLEPKSAASVFPGYFSQLAELANKNSNKKISSRVRFMIQDVIDLREGQWVPRRDDSNPKTMDQIQKEAESERLEIEMNNSTPMNTPRKDDRNNDRRRNRGGGGGGGGSGGGSDDGWTLSLGKTSRHPYSVEAAKLNAKSLPLDEIKLGSRTAYLFGGSAAATKPNTLGTPNKFAALENLDQDKQRVMPQLSGSRSTGAREYGRSDQYKAWEGRGSRNGGHMNSSSTSSIREGTFMEVSRSQSVSMPPPSTKYEPPTSVMMHSNPANSKPAKSEEQLKKIIKVVLDLCNRPQTDAFITDAIDVMKEHFDNSTYPLFVRETLNSILEKPSTFRQRFSVLYAYMVNNNMMSLSVFQAEYEKNLELVHELVIDIPKCWTYFAEVLSELVRLDAHPLVELKETIAVLKPMGTSSKLIGELFTKLAQELGPKSVAKMWDQSGLRWADLIDISRENPDNIVKQYKLEYLTSDCMDTDECSGPELSMEQIHDQLVRLMHKNHFDNITSWISAHVGERSKLPQFIRVFVTAILEVSTETTPTLNSQAGNSSTSWKLNSEKFESLLPLITRYVDTAPHLELQCLFAVQFYVDKLEHPQGFLGNVIDALWQGTVISDDAFLSWQRCTDPAEMMGHAVAVNMLTSFFVTLQEPHDESSEEA